MQKKKEIITISRIRKKKLFIYIKAKELKVNVL